MAPNRNHEGFASDLESDESEQFAREEVSSPVALPSDDPVPVPDLRTSDSARIAQLKEEISHATQEDIPLAPEESLEQIRARLGIVIPPQPKPPAGLRLKLVKLFVTEQMKFLQRKAGFDKASSRRYVSSQLSSIALLRVPSQFNTDIKINIEKIRHNLPAYEALFYTVDTDPHEISNEIRRLCYAVTFLRENRGKLGEEYQGLESELVEVFKGAIKNLGRLIALGLEGNAIQGVYQMSRPRSSYWNGIKDEIAAQIGSVAPLVKEAWFKNNEVRNTNSTERDELCLATIMPEEISSLAEESLRKRFAEDALTGASLIGSPFARAKELGETFTASLIPESLGEHRIELAKIWANSSSDAVYRAREVLEENLKTINELEKTEPGAAKTLFENDGIAVFGRYPIELLRKQYQDRNKTDKPYGIILNAYHDWNASFFHQSEEKLTQETREDDASSITPEIGELRDHGLYKHITEQLADTYRVYFLEAGGKTDIARRLLTLQKRDPIHKIDFALIGAHGNEDLMCFGNDTKPNSYVTITDLVRPRIKRAKDFFAKGAPIVLASCKTGLPKAIGQQLSKELGLQIIAPDSNTSLENLDITLMSSGGVEFHPTYREASPQEYIEGVAAGK